MPAEPTRHKAAHPNLKEVTIKLAAHKEHNFKWQMVFNTYDIENLGQGAIVRFAYVMKGGMASEVVPILISPEGLRHLAESAKRYIQEFSPSAPSLVLKSVPDARQFSPLFSNNVMVSKSGTMGEVQFQTVLLNDIANLSLGRVTPETEFSTVEVALMHSTVQIHERLVLDLVSLAIEQ